MIIPLSEIYALFLESTGICTDSRHLEPGQIFLALVGDHFDGNQFAISALAKGATYAIVSEASLVEEDSRCLYQPNTLSTLHRLAALHRKNFSGVVVGITGSNGKTTTKELIVSVLRQKFNVFGTQGNLNNHIGVPLTLLSLKDIHDIAIIEMGANHRGEIKLLCAIADPDYGYITNIGHAHLEGFGSIEAIRETKFALFHHVVNKPGAGCFFLNSDEPSLIEHISSKSPRIESFSRHRFKDIEVIPKITFDWRENRSIKSDLYGEYNFSNIIAAISIGEHLGLSIEEIESGVEAYQPDANRSQMVKWLGHQIYLDAYNANPTSVAAVLTFFKSLEAENKVLVLGDMLETGELAHDVHREVLRQVQGLHLTKVFLVGEIYSSLATEFAATDWVFSISRSAVRAHLLELTIPCTIYMKGSRAIGLETIIAVESGRPQTNP